jgi:hypothetical protein
VLPPCLRLLRACSQGLGFRRRWGVPPRVRGANGRSAAASGDAQGNKSARLRLLAVA